MTYQVNDTVLYSADVCRITEIAEKEMSGHRAEYYVLKPVYDDKTVIYVPVNNERAISKMRRALSPSEIHALIKAMPKESTIWIDNDSVRREQYKEILSHGNRVELVRLIKTLYLRQQSQKAKGRKLHIADERFMKDAEKMLYDEFAYVLNIKPDQVLPLILEQIESQERWS